MTHTPEQLRKAREIADSLVSKRDGITGCVAENYAINWNLAYNAALAAIVATEADVTERTLRWLRVQPNMVQVSSAHVRANGPQLLACAIEQGKHLREPSAS